MNQASNLCALNRAILLVNSDQARSRPGHVWGSEVSPLRFWQLESWTPCWHWQNSLLNVYCYIKQVKLKLMGFPLQFSCGGLESNESTEWGPLADWGRFLLPPPKQMYQIVPAEGAGQVKARIQQKTRPCLCLRMSSIDEPTQREPSWRRRAEGLQIPLFLAYAQEKNYPVAFGCVAGQQLTNQLPSCWQGKGPRYHDLSIANSEQTWQLKIIILLLFKSISIVSDYHKEVMCIDLWFFQFWFRVVPTEYT